MAKKQLDTSIIIDAKPTIIWDILKDFKAYKSWNPFITSIEGEAEKGKFLKINAGGMKFQPEVLNVVENKELRWKGKLLVKGLFDGEHIFQIEDNNDGSSTFIQSEKFSGLLVGLFAKKLDGDTLQGFIKMNETLKEIAEKRVGVMK